MKNQMISISENELSNLLQSAIMLKQHMECLDIDACYNIIEDGSLDSETYDKTGEYSDEENQIMEDRVETYLSSLNTTIGKNLSILIEYYNQKLNK
jgi:hypothetical protein